MSDEIKSMHGLHVVNFDSKINISELCEETFKINDTIHAKNTQENLKPQTFTAGKNPDYMKIQSISDTALWSSRVNNAVKSVLGKTSFSPFQKPFHKRSVSINDLKQNSSSSNLVFSKRIKRILKSAASQTKHERKGNQKVKPCNELSNNHKLQVLFSSKTKNLTKKIRNRSFCRECRRLDLFYDSKSSGDFFGFNSNKNTCKSHLCYHHLTSQSKRRFPPCHFNYRNNRQDDECVDSLIEDVNSNTTVSYAYKIPIQHNFVEFPCDFGPYHTEPRTFKRCGDETDRNDPCSCCVHEQVSVTSTCISTRKDDGDCLLNSQFILNPNIAIQRDEIYIKNNNDNILKHRDCAGCTIKPIFLQTIDLVEKPLSKAKSVAKSALKYILFVLAVIAWSPCIITLCLYLLIVYPLRPQNIYKDYIETDVCCQCGSCFKCRHNFLLSVYRYFVRFGKKVPYAFNAFLKDKTFIKPCPCLSQVYSYRQPRCKHRRLNNPNPKNKYILCFSRCRGWLMKPIRKSVKKNCCQSKFMNDQFRQKEIRNFPKDRKDLDDRACKILELENKTLHSNKNSVRRINMPKMIYKKTSHIQIKPSLKQKSILEMPKREDCDLSSIRKLKCRKRFKKLPLCIQAPKNDSHIKRSEKTCKKISFKGNLPSPPLKMRDQLHYKHYQHQMANLSKLPGGFSCACCHQEKENLKTKGKVKPSAFNYKMYASKGHKFSSNLRICCLCQSVQKKVKGTVKDIGPPLWKFYICDHMFAHTLRKRPCFWFHSLCPPFYPYFLIIHRFFKNIIHVLMLMFSICIWCPLIFCSYIFYSLCCSCLINRTVVV